MTRLVSKGDNQMTTHPIRALSAFVVALLVSGMFVGAATSTLPALA